jgi:hypothetical protein
MRYLRLVLLPLVFAACTEREPAAPDIDMAPTLSATHTTSNVFDFPWSALLDEPCMPEAVYAEGYIHFMLIETFTPSGNYMGRWKGQPQGLKGVGLTTGLTYQFNGVTQDTYVVQGDGFPLTDTFVNRFLVIGPGPGNNYVMQDTGKLTINGVGDVVVDFYETTIECR